MESVVLNTLDRQLIHALRLDGRASFSRIADVIGTSDRTVARRYQRLREAGALRVVGLPDAGRTGLVEWFVRLECAPEAALPVAKALAERADTFWVGLSSGGTEITCVTQARQGSLSGSLLLPKLPKTSRLTSVKAQCRLRIVAGESGWRGSMSALDPRQTAALTRAVDTSRALRLTERDERLLRVLAQDGRAAVPQLAAATGWSESSVRRRMEELRYAGVLRFDVEIDPALYDRPLETMLWLTVAPAALNRVAESLAEHPEVAYAAVTTGQSNVVAVVLCREPDDLYDYLATRVGDLPGVLGAETTPVTRHIKRLGTVLAPSPARLRP
ncbi:AsnC family transcriptional regulator [Streptomyces albospinus]|uniref:AsnC family transcriptional regulator n=1 Tax=Streptomyces albospinus TaxID=285515 RepID=A0ABQ2VPZ6_9ACTN|nr:AsnC family transcriptional regulator [Streptomyces albospinus]GGU96210.1 AsnC family transcriptional regulator [Streptomyces albospinus]